MQRKPYEQIIVHIEMQGRIYTPNALVESSSPEGCRLIKPEPSVTDAQLDKTTGAARQAALGDELACGIEKIHVSIADISGRLLLHHAADLPEDTR